MNTLSQHAASNKRILYTFYQLYMNIHQPRPYSEYRPSINLTVYTSILFVIQLWESYNSFHGLSFNLLSISFSFLWIMEVLNRCKTKQSNKTKKHGKLLVILLYFVIIMKNENICQFLNIYSEFIPISHTWMIKYHGSDMTIPHRNEDLSTPYPMFVKPSQDIFLDYLNEAPPVQFSLKISWYKMILEIVCLRQTQNFKKC